MGKLKEPHAALNEAYADILGGLCEATVRNQEGLPQDSAWSKMKMGI